jgi:parallel beta-helix repeat protein
MRENAGFTTISNCRIEWNTGDGIRMYKAHDTTVSNCEFDRNGNAGIHLVETKRSKLTNCTFRRNGAASDLADDDYTNNVHIYAQANRELIVSNNNTRSMREFDSGTGRLIPANSLTFINNTNSIVSSNLLIGGTKYPDDLDGLCKISGNTNCILPLNISNSQIDARDADMLDGKHAEDFALAEHSHAYLKVYDNAGAHNAVYRGKYLGNAVTDAQYAAIAAGTFTDLYIGDYWTINGFNWRIVEFDYYLNGGNPICLKHHVVLVPDTSLYRHVMNDTNTTVGGYVGSKMYTEGLEQAKIMINEIFSGHVLSKSIYLVNAVTNGQASAGANYYGEVELMNEQMVYGGPIFMAMGNGSMIPVNCRCEASQLALFRHEPSRIRSSPDWWLRDVVSESNFARVMDLATAYNNAASFEYGVRPAFCIC